MAWTLSKVNNEGKVIWKPDIGEWVEIFGSNNCLDVYEHSWSQTIYVYIVLFALRRYLGLRVTIFSSTRKLTDHTLDFYQSAEDQH